MDLASPLKITATSPRGIAATSPETTRTRGTLPSLLLPLCRQQKTKRRFRNFNNKVGPTQAGPTQAVGEKASGTHISETANWRSGEGAADSGACEDGESFFVFLCVFRFLFCFGFFRCT